MEVYCVECMVHYPGGKSEDTSPIHISLILCEPENEATVHTCTTFTGYCISFRKGWGAAV